MVVVVMAAVVAVTAAVVAAVVVLWGTATGSHVVIVAAVVVLVGTATQLPLMDRYPQSWMALLSLLASILSRNLVGVTHWW